MQQKLYLDKSEITQTKQVAHTCVLRKNMHAHTHRHTHGIHIEIYTCTRQQLMKGGQECEGAQGGLWGGLTVRTVKEETVI